jgi:hypothetical protein
VPLAAVTSVTVSVMQIGKVPMAVPDRPMGMLMRVWLGAVPGAVMLVLMMRVMHMRVDMAQRFMSMFMFVTLDQVQPDTRGHQQR